MMKTKIYVLAALCSILFIAAGCSKEDKDPSAVLKVEPTVVTNVYSAGGYIELAVTSNISWSAQSSVDWITVTPTVGSGSYIVKAYVFRNADITGRLGKVTISPVSTETEASPVMVSISQLGMDE